MRSKAPSHTAPSTESRGGTRKKKDKGGDSAWDPPLPIPNREVKPRRADGTAKAGEQVAAPLMRRRGPGTQVQGPLPFFVPMQERDPCDTRPERTRSRTHEPCVPTASIHRPAPNGGQRHRTASIRSPSKETPSIRTAKSIPSPRNGEQRHCTDGIRSPDLKLRPASWTKRAATASPAGIHRCR